MDVVNLREVHALRRPLVAEFVWHHHDAGDELFLVVSGRLLMQLNKAT